MDALSNVYEFVIHDHVDTDWIDMSPAESGAARRQPAPRVETMIETLDVVAAVYESVAA